MSAFRGTAAVPQTSTLAALTAARTAKGPDTNDATFGDKLTEAQRPTGSSGIPVSRQHQDPQHRDPQRRDTQHQDPQHPGGQRQPQPPERDVPRHPVLRDRSGRVSAPSRPATTAVSRNPVLLHPRTTADAEALALQAAAPVAQPLQAKPAPTTAPVTPGVTATAAPGNPANAATTAPATTALVAGSTSATAAPDRQQPAADAAAAATPSDAQQTAAPAAGSPAAQAQPPSPVQITVTTPLSAVSPAPAPQPPAHTEVPLAASAPPPGPVQQPAPEQQPAPAAATPTASTPTAQPQVSAEASAIAQPTSQHHVAPGQPDAVQPTTAPAVTVTGAPTDRETADQGPSQQPGHEPAPASHNHATTGDTAPVGAPATPYSSAADRTQLTSPTAGAPAEARTAQEVPATQALPAGTLAQVNAAEHSVRVQVETQALGKVTAEMHTRPGEIGVHLSVPDDAGRAFMAQRLDALRDSLGQGGSAVHLSLAAQESPSQGQQSSTPREDRASAQSAPQPHDAATPRATDGSPMTPAPADGTRLVDVHA